MSAFHSMHVLGNASEMRITDYMELAQKEAHFLYSSLTLLLLCLLVLLNYKMQCLVLPTQKFDVYQLVEMSINGKSTAFFFFSVF